MKANKIKLNDEVLIDLTQDTVEEADVLFGKTFHKADGSIAVGTAELVAALNIIYGDIAPEDTNKLWVKTSKPSKVIVSPNVEYVDGENFSLTQKGTVTPQRNSHPVAYGTNVYFFCGPSYSTTTVKYDTVKDVATTLPVKYPVSLMEPKGILHGTKIYLFGGYYGTTPEDSIVRFETRNETLTKLTDTALSVGTKDHVVAKVGSKIYIIGGDDGTGYTGKVECFDTETEKCALLENATVPALPYAYAYAHNDVIYLFYYHVGVPESRVIKFNTTTFDVVTVCDEIPNITGGPMFGSIDGKLLIVGGRSNKSIRIFDPLIESFLPITQNIDVSGNFKHCCNVGDDIYSFVEFENAYVFGYEQLVSLAEGALQLISTSTKNLFPLINTETVKVETGVVCAFKGNANGVGEAVETAIYKDGAWETI